VKLFRVIMLAWVYEKISDLFFRPRKAPGATPGEYMLIKNTFNAKKWAMLRRETERNEINRRPWRQKRGWYKFIDSDY